MTTPTRIEGRCVWLREAIAPGETDCAALAKRRRGGCLHRRRRPCRACGRRSNIKARKPSADVAIVEADICGGGASGRNSGMVLSQWAKFAALEAFCGTEGAIRLGQRFRQLRRPNIEAFCSENGIDAEFRRDGWIWGATCAKHVGSWNGILAGAGKARSPSLPARSSPGDRRAMTGIAVVPVPASTIRPRPRSIPESWCAACAAWRCSGACGSSRIRR